MTKGEFDELLSFIFPESLGGNSLHENWMNIVDMFSTSRYFIAKQGITLLARVGASAIFERLDLACLIYDSLLRA